MLREDYVEYNLENESVKCLSSECGAGPQV